MLVARITEEQQRRAQGLISGAAQTFDEYRSQTGFLSALEFVKNLCEDVERDLYHGGSSKKN
jgi:hypothetical protein